MKPESTCISCPLLCSFFLTRPSLQCGGSVCGQRPGAVEESHAGVCDVHPVWSAVQHQSCTCVSPHREVCPHGCQRHHRSEDNPFLPSHTLSFRKKKSQSWSFLFAFKLAQFYIFWHKSKVSFMFQAAKMAPMISTGTNIQSRIIPFKASPHQWQLLPVYLDFTLFSQRCLTC